MKAIDKIEELLKNGEYNNGDMEYLIKKVREDDKKEYGLVYETHVEGVELRLNKGEVYLEEDVELRIDEGENKEISNSIIEGDNLESLTYLKKKGETFDVIYIDPPYSTGTKSWKYNDHFRDKNDSFIHSKWLSFMEKRLRLARELLTDDGVIFISIDDNELYNLKLLCDEVFGKDNFLSNFVWEKNRNASSLSKNVRKNTEYILSYKKEKYGGFISKIRIQDDDFSFYNKSNSEITWEIPGEYIDVKIEDGIYKKGVIGNIELIEDVTVEGGMIKGRLKIRSKFTMREETVLRELRDNKIRILIKTENFVPRKTGVNRIIKVRPTTLITGEEGGTTRNSYRLMTDLKLEKKFEYTKPVKLLKEFIGYYDKGVENNGLTILDFFAGSGSLGHAVLEYNKENGTNHEFILCTNNENNICREVTYQRLSKVIKGYKTPKGKEVEGIPSNLKYYKTELKEKEDGNI